MAPQNRKPSSKATRTFTAPSTSELKGPGTSPSKDIVLGGKNGDVGTAPDGAK